MLCLKPPIAALAVMGLLLAGYASIIGCFTNFVNMLVVEISP
jgi:hypothetical protein